MQVPIRMMGCETRQNKTSNSITNSFKFKRINLATVNHSIFTSRIYDEREEIIYLPNVKRNLNDYNFKSKYSSFYGS